jgi:hypothetical protein
MLDCKKIYIDTRFKTPDSKSDSDFFVELPNTVNIPDNCVCYIDDVVIPVSWNTVDERNYKLYIRFNQTGFYTYYYNILELPKKNYTGPTFAAALEVLLNSATYLNLKTPRFSVSYLVLDNLLTITQEDGFDVMVLTIISDTDLAYGRLWDPAMKTPCSLNGILRIEKSVQLTSQNPSHTAYIDLHTTRNLYLTSSSMASYNTMSNFKNDVIIKKIPVRANYGQMIFEGASNGYDYLQLSKRTLRRLDFRLEDSFGNILNLNGNHWSFSLVFMIQ